MDTIHQQKILILDFGSQYTQLIARVVREIGVYCEILPYYTSEESITDFKPNGIILSGGPNSTVEMASPKAANIVFTLDVPVLGICYGMQLMASYFGGEVKTSDKREFGYAEINVIHPSRLLDNIEDELSDEGLAKLDVWMSHGDKVSKVPKDFDVIAQSGNAPICAFACEAKRFYGLQFHPEVTHTLQGRRILSRFVLDICELEANWNPKNIAHDLTASVKEQVGEDKVLLALSGGVDSSVVAALLHKAIGPQLVCVFVDTGLLRLNEASEVIKMFGQHMGINLIHVNASDIYFQALEGVSNPEEKRKIIGKIFIDIFKGESEKLDGIKYLAQGTIYPDVIESATDGHADVIKSHHNVGGLPSDMPFELIEPIRELFKDEVRKLGLELGLPYEMVYRHPFPGPGLGVRVLGEVKKDYVEMLRRADNIFIECLRQEKLYDQVSQAFAVFLPVKSVGVMGDKRQYEYVISLRCVETIDFMTARWSHLPHEFLGHVSNRIINEVQGISRVTYDISGKPPATIEWE